MGLWDIVILAAVLLLAGLAVFAALRRRKAGKGCGGGCAGCPRAGNCAGIKDRAAAQAARENKEARPHGDA